MPQAVTPDQASKGRDNERKQTHRDDSHTLLQRGRSRCRCCSPGSPRSLRTPSWHRTMTIASTIASCSWTTGRRIRPATKSASSPATVSTRLHLPLPQLRQGACHARRHPAACAGRLDEYLYRTFIQTKNLLSYLIEEEQYEGALTIIRKVSARTRTAVPARYRPWLHEFLQIHRTAQAILDAAELVQRTSIGGVGGVLVLVGGLR